MTGILIADDEPIERAVISRIIEKQYSDEVRIVRAVNGREAISKFQEEHCRIAILDIEMPGINGLQAAEQIRREDPDCSIIFLTAFDEFSYAKKAISVKALDYLLKPGFNEELISVLDEALRIARREERQKASVDAGKPAVETGKSRLEETGNAGDQYPEGEAEPGHVRLQTFRRRMEQFIENHYMEDISLQDAAGLLNYSDAYFCKLFKQCFDQNFTSYLSGIRVEKAKVLLGCVDVNVREISEKTGFRDSNYFTKVFKRNVGMTPSEYRAKVL